MFEGIQNRQAKLNGFFNGGNIAGGTPSVQSSPEIGNILNSGGIGNHPSQNTYAEFNKALQQSPLDNKFMTAERLEAKGWQKSKMMDTNGGIYYKNPQTGESVRVQSHCVGGRDAGSSNLYENKNMADYVHYGKDGKPTNGVLQVKQPDGSIKVYEYEFDVDGNKFIKSVKTSQYDYFAAYE